MLYHVRYLPIACMLFTFAGCGGGDNQTALTPDETTMGKNDLWDATYDRILKQHGDDVQLNQIPKPQQAVLAVVNSHGILGNGGFQYLFEGDFPGDPGFVLTRQAYATIGANDAIAAFDKAFAVFPNSTPPADIDERLRIWQSNYNLRDSLTDDSSPDSMYFSAMDGVLSRLNEYIRENPDAFADLPN